MTQDMMTLRALLEKSSDADLLREMIGKVPKLAVLMDEAEHDVLAYMTFVWTPPGTQGPI